VLESLAQTALAPSDESRARAATNAGHSDSLPTFSAADDLMSILQSTLDVGPDV
jgi:hypothetical protein